jgi:hypothetical protein
LGWALHSSTVFTSNKWLASGPTEENPDAVTDTGLTKSGVAEMITAWSKNMAAAQAAMVGAGGFNQQLMIGQHHVSQHDKVLPCGTFLREACQPVSTVLQANAANKID